MAQGRAIPTTRTRRSDTFELNDLSHTLTRPHKKAPAMDDNFLDRDITEHVMAKQTADAQFLHSEVIRLSTVSKRAEHATTEHLKLLETVWNDLHEHAARPGHNPAALNRVINDIYAHLEVHLAPREVLARSSMDIEPGRLVHSPVSVPDVRALGVNNVAANAGIDLRAPFPPNEPVTPLFSPITPPAPPFSPTTPPLPLPASASAPAPALAEKSRKRKAAEVLAPREKKSRAVKKEDVNYKFWARYKAVYDASRHDYG